MCFVSLLGSGPGVCIHWAWAPGGGKLAKIQHPPRTVDPVAETSPVLLSPVSAEVGKKSSSSAPLPSGCRRGPFQASVTGVQPAGSRGMAFWGVSVFLVGQRSGSFFILLYISFY